MEAEHVHEERERAMAIARKYDDERVSIATHRDNVEALLANIVVELRAGNAIAQDTNEVTKRLLAQIQKVINPVHVITDAGMEDIPL